MALTPLMEDCTIKHHRAFDALLAVAKASARLPDGQEPTVTQLEAVWDAVIALDAAHPDWREWESHPAPRISHG